MTKEEFEIQETKYNHTFRRKWTWPLVGDIMTFTGVPEFFYPHFTDMAEDANNKLVKGQKYTVCKCEVYSSWCAIWLTEIGEDGPKNWYNLAFFNKDLTKQDNVIL